ncbi:MAG: rhodanese-like domain-containing protein [Porticoccaceae bacterium]|nr:rhodanese-like domain-containing protein [Porticoccaceae bacterium]
MTDSFQHLIEPEELQATTDPVLIIDLCNDHQYLQGHIPGAVHVSAAEIMDGRPPAPGRLPDKHRLDKLFSRLGYRSDANIVVYDDEGGGWAGRMAWILDVIGHKHWRYLNGGLTAWQQANLPLETSAVIPAPTQVDVTISKAPTIEADDIIASLGKQNFLVWDARSRAEYEGSRVVSQRGGHIPGAIHCEWTTLMDPARGLRVRRDALQFLADRGITPDKEIATHCQSHHRSGFTYLVARILGFPRIRAYHGSWSEWGNRMDTPVETGL